MKYYIQMKSYSPRNAKTSKRVLSKSSTAERKIFDYPCNTPRAQWKSPSRAEAALVRSIHWAKSALAIGDQSGLSETQVRGLYGIVHTFTVESID